MKYILALLSILISSSALSSHKILWWNIGYNDYSLPSQTNPGQTNLDDSLKTIDWDQYDVVAFGEFIPRTLDKDSLNNLKSLFPHQKVLKYNNAYGKSLYIFSKNKFKFKVSTIGWANPNDNLLEQLKYKQEMVNKYGNMDTFVRKYIRITLSLSGIDYNFVFFHLNNPWMLFKKHDGILKLGYELLFGTENPLYNQILNLQNSLVKDLGQNFQRKNVVLMGDSNCPRKAKGLTPVCYKLLEEILPVVLDEKKEITFPAKGSIVYNKLPKVKIDHVQTSSHIRSTSSVLDFVGSDHRAVELTLD